MITFFAALVILIVGYMIYGKIVEKIFAPNDHATPAVANPDGVDYVPISTGKAFEYCRPWSYFWRDFWSHVGT